ncbi:hypothetical protein BH09BAC5_BH09BAC5_08950 [soil metagenome]
MKKILLPLFSILIIAVFFAGCDKADMKIKKLYRGDGTWTIESFTTEYFNAAGNSVDSTVTDESYGEIAFFKSTTLDALWDYHFAVIYQQDAEGHYHEFPCGVYFDGERAHVEDNVYPENCPYKFLGLWTVEVNGRRKQEWTQFSLRTSDNSLYAKTTIKMKFK